MLWESFMYKNLWDSMWIRILTQNGRINRTAQSKAGRKYRMKPNSYVSNLSESNYKMPRDPNFKWLHSNYFTCPCQQSI